MTIAAATPETIRDILIAAGFSTHEARTRRSFTGRNDVALTFGGSADPRARAEHGVGVLTSAGYTVEKIAGTLYRVTVATRRPVPRYVGSITEAHGDVVDVRPCTLPCCIERPEHEHPHASLTVYPDAGGSAVRLDRVRFTSFTGRP